MTCRVHLTASDDDANAGDEQKQRSSTTLVVPPSQPSPCGAQMAFWAELEQVGMQSRSTSGLHGRCIRRLNSPMLVGSVGGRYPLEQGRLNSSIGGPKGRPSSFPSSACQKWALWRNHGGQPTETRVPGIARHLVAGCRCRHEPQWARMCPSDPTDWMEIQVDGRRGPEVGAHRRHSARSPATALEAYGGECTSKNRLFLFWIAGAQCQFLGTG
ncbi:hypothetical protein B0T14DRAFT_244288 [Immersiella caudata]|uniref:Uncharacterized protein n=1 Tax=Immersiella caudata TaxID=314043 RepID=A0AA40BWL4_9PEZI|nr:hypothetical protein B0T14DRAFT_244288 [Immersiella caudata]